jgi:hypothetical protein
MYPLNTKIHILFIDGEMRYYTIFRYISCKFQSIGIMSLQRLDSLIAASIDFIDLVVGHVGEEVETQCVARVALLVEVMDVACSLLENVEASGLLVGLAFHLVVNAPTFVQSP